MTNQDSTTTPDPKKEQQEAQNELQAAIDLMERAKSEYDALTDEKKATRP